MMFIVYIQNAKTHKNEKWRLVYTAQLVGKERDIYIYIYFLPLYHLYLGIYTPVGKTWHSSKYHHIIDRDRMYINTIDNAGTLYTSVLRLLFIAVLV